jgi:PilZ domain
MAFTPRRDHHEANMLDSVARSSTGALDFTGGLAPDRRRAQRHKIRDASCTLAWGETPDGVVAHAKVVDISGLGAAVLAERAPAPGQAVRVLLESRSSILEPFDAKTVAVSADPSGKRLIRLEFRSWVPLETYLETHAERRLWQRYPVRDKRAAILWLEQDIEKRVSGELLNISGGGAAVLSGVSIPDGTQVWFMLDAAAGANDPVECRLVCTSSNPSGLPVSHLSFVESCPMPLFEAAVSGSR